jgi:ketosteroid isomerase-like protein
MSGNQSVAEAIGRAEQARDQALKNGDSEALSGMLAEDYLYVHASGRLEDKGAYIAAATSGKTKYLDFSRSDVTVKAYGDAALAAGAIRVTSMQGNEQSTKPFRYASVWVKNGGDWRLAYWQNTRAA